jgi:hypothetical protein
MAGDLNTSKPLLLTQAVAEAGWNKAGLDHNMPLNNPFGINDIRNGQVVGNHRYSSLDDAIEDWERQFGDRVRGAKTPRDFINGLQQPKLGGRYNSVNPNYSKRYLNLYPDVVKAMGDCGIAQ